MNTLDSFRLDGKSAVVTGAGHGLGRAIALAFADAGADVLVAARRQGPIDEVASEIRARGRKALAVSADLRDAASPARLVGIAKETFGKIDIWVSNAGGTDDPTAFKLADTTEEHWDEVVELNMKATWRCAKEASKAIEDGGVILNMSSVFSLKGAENGYGPYAASKAAINRLTQILSLELAPRGIRVNAVAPGPVPTESFRKATIGATVDMTQLAKEWGVPLGRVGTPEDIANAFVYLASPAASWVSGQTLVVAGGM
jgi:7-alpha-hydroxysteroid dehydrogenase